MTRLSLLIYAFICTILTPLRLWAQDDGDDPIIGRRGGASDIETGEGFVDYQPIRFGITDVILVILLVVACYVFGKIWKGCSYLIIVAAALFYYLNH